MRNDIVLRDDVDEQGVRQACSLPPQHNKCLDVDRTRRIDYMERALYCYGGSR